MLAKIGSSPTSPQVRLAGPAEQKLRAIALRRADLVQANPRAADAVAVALAAMHDTAHGHMATLGSRSERVTQYQLGAHRATTFEDIADWLHRDGPSRKVALAGVVTLLASVGWEARPCSFGLLSVPEAAAAVARTVGDQQSELALAQADGMLEPHELASLAKRAEAVHVAAGVMQTACVRGQVDRD